jgi:hypothetical protein
MLSLSPLSVCSCMRSSVAETSCQPICSSSYSVCQLWRGRRTVTLVLAINLVALDKILAQELGDILGMLNSLGGGGIGRVEGLLFAETAANLGLRSQENWCVTYIQPGSQQAMDVLRWRSPRAEIWSKVWRSRRGLSNVQWAESPTFKGNPGGAEEASIRC